MGAALFIFHKKTVVAHADPYHSFFAIARVSYSKIKVLCKAIKKKMLLIAECSFARLLYSIILQV